MTILKVIPVVFLVNLQCHLAEAGLFSGAYWPWIEKTQAQKVVNVKWYLNNGKLDEASTKLTKYWNDLGAKTRESLRNNITEAQVIALWKANKHAAAWNKLRQHWAELDKKRRVSLRNRITQDHIKQEWESCKKSKGKQDAVKNVLIKEYATKLDRSGEDKRERKRLERVITRLEIQDGIKEKKYEKVCEKLEKYQKDLEALRDSVSEERDDKNFSKTDVKEYRELLQRSRRDNAYSKVEALRSKIQPLMEAKQYKDARAEIMKYKNLKLDPVVKKLVKSGLDKLAKPIESKISELQKFVQRKENLVTALTQAEKSLNRILKNKKHNEKMAVPEEFRRKIFGIIADICVHDSPRDAAVYLMHNPKELAESIYEYYLKHLEEVRYRSGFEEYARSMLQFNQLRIYESAISLTKEVYERYEYPLCLHDNSITGKDFQTHFQEQ